MSTIRAPRPQSAAALDWVSQSSGDWERCWTTGLMCGPLQARVHVSPLRFPSAKHASIMNQLRIRLARTSPSQTLSLSSRTRRQFSIGGAWLRYLQRHARDAPRAAISTTSPPPAETSTPVSRLQTAFALTPAHAGEEITSRAWTRVSKVGSIALTVALIEAQSLRSHTLYLLIKRVNFLIKPRVLRSRRIAAAQPFERFLNGEFGGFSHGNHPKT